MSHGIATGDSGDLRVAAVYAASVATKKRHAKPSNTLFPGTGQLLNRQPRKAALLALLAYVLTILFLKTRLPFAFWSRLTKPASKAPGQVFGGLCVGSAGPLVAPVSRVMEAKEYQDRSGGLCLILTVRETRKNGPQGPDKLACGLLR